MKRIKLKDFKGEYICYELDEIYLVDATDNQYIEELLEDGIKKFYGTLKEIIFSENSIKNMIEEYVENYGYDDMIEHIDFESKEFKELVKVFNKFIKSLGSYNECYYKDNELIVEVK